MKLLLHACCGPCSLEPTRLLRKAGYDLTIFFANSNIAPNDEYMRRLATLRSWAADENLPVLEGLYEPAAWEASAGRIGNEALAQAKLRAIDANLVDGSEGKAGYTHASVVCPAQREARCRACYRLRFEETALAAVAAGFDAISTTLSVSPYQLTDSIRDELHSAATRFGVKAVFEDFSPYYNEATRRSRALGMYRQNYCGCRFSKAEADAERTRLKAERAAKREALRATQTATQIAEDAARATRLAERAVYESKQAKKRAVLKALREKRSSEGEQ